MSVIPDPTRAPSIAHRIAELLPAFPPDLPTSASIGSGGPLAHGTIVGLRRLIGAMYPTVAPEAVRLCATWGELLEILVPHEPQDFRLPAAKRGDGEGYSVRLRPLRQEDIGLLYEAALDPAEGFRWRFRGRGTSPEAFSHFLHDGVLVQFMVETLENQLPIGLVMAYNYRPEAGHCAAGIQRALPGAGLGGEMIEGAFLFLGHLFRSFPLRKVFVDIPEYNAYLVPRDGGLLQPDGCNRDYYYHDGRYWDRQFYSVTADRFAAYEEQFYASATGPGQGDG